MPPPSGFIAKVRALNAATVLYPKSEDALPLGEVVRILGEETGPAGGGEGGTAPDIKDR